MSMPPVHTAFANRSTSTVVLPVPAPAETKTSPLAAIAAACCSFGSLTGPLRPLDPAHPPEVAPRGTAVGALRVVPDVAGAHALREAEREVARALDLSPERLLVEVVALHEAGQRVVLRLGAQQAARPPLAGERAVEAAERLDPDEVAQDEHVERDLEPQLLLDLRRRVAGSAGLVVLDDPARAAGVDVDPVDLPREHHA